MKRRRNINDSSDLIDDLFNEACSKRVLLNEKGENFFASEEPVELCSGFWDLKISAMNVEVRDRLPEMNIPGHECHVSQPTFESCKSKIYSLCSQNPHVSTVVPEIFSRASPSTVMAPFIRHDGVHCIHGGESSHSNEMSSTDRQVYFQ